MRVTIYPKRMQTLFDYSSTAPSPAYDWQDDLARAMDRQLKQDHDAIRSRGIIPPWINFDQPLQQDEARLLGAIADNMGLPWSDSNGPVCLSTTRAIGMTAIGNARAVIVRCLRMGYSCCTYDAATCNMRLDLTMIGRELLDMFEDDQNLNAGE